MLNLVLSLSLSHTGHWKFNMAPHGKELSEDLKKIIVALHKDGVGYKKITKTLKLSCSMVAKITQRFNKTGSTQNRPRLWSAKEVECTCSASYPELVFGKLTYESATKGWGGQPVSVPHTASNWSAWLSSQKEASSKDDEQERTANNLLKTSRLRTWITGNMTCGLMRPR